MTFERSWTSTSGSWSKREPFGLVPIVAIPLYTGAVALAGALGLSTYQSIFGSNQATFDEGWKNGETFDARMAAMKQLWLKFDQSIQLRCPGFVTKDGGKWWRQFKNDLNEFGTFYASVGTHKGYFSSWTSGEAAAEQIGGAQARLSSLIGWGQEIERSCPGTFPGLGVTLTQTEAEKAAEQKRLEDAKGEKGFLDSFGTNLGVTLGLSLVGLGILAYIVRPKVSVGLGQFESRRGRDRRSARRSSRFLV